jgi:hypothetical protein
VDHWRALNKRADREATVWVTRQWDQHRAERDFRDELDLWVGATLQNIADSSGALREAYPLQETAAGAAGFVGAGGWPRPRGA